MHAEPEPAQGLTKRPKLTDVFTGDDIFPVEETPEPTPRSDLPSVQPSDRYRSRPERGKRSAPAKLDRADKPIRKSGPKPARPVKRSRSGAPGTRKS